MQRHPTERMTILSASVPELACPIRRVLAALFDVILFRFA
jgi:hypothetical protein